MLIINGCVHLGTDLFNHSKGLFFNRSVDKFSECQYNKCPFMFKSGRTFQMVGQTYQIKRKQNKKGGEKSMGGKIGRKKRKKRKKKRKKEESTKQKDKEGG